MRTILALLALGVSALPANARDSAAKRDVAFFAAMSQMLGTIRVSSQPMMTSGTLTGCTLLFDALHQDQAYRQGQFIKVSGNVGIVGMGGTLGATVKVVLTDVDPTSFDLAPASPAPTRAYLIADDYSNNLASLVSASGSDTPGAVFAIYQIEPSFQIVMAGLERGKLTFAFNRGDGRTDILLPVEIDVSDMQADGYRVRSPNAEQEFLSCLGALIASVPK